LRIKEQETHLTLQEYDDDDDDIVYYSKWSYILETGYVSALR